MLTPRPRAGRGPRAAGRVTPRCCAPWSAARGRARDGPWAWPGSTPLPALPPTLRGPCGGASPSSYTPQTPPTSTSPRCWPPRRKRGAGAGWLLRGPLSPPPQPPSHTTTLPRSHLPLTTYIRAPLLELLELPWQQLLRRIMVVCWEGRAVGVVAEVCVLDLQWRRSSSPGLARVWPQWLTAAAALLPVYSTAAPTPSRPPLPAWTRLQWPQRQLPRCHSTASHPPLLQHHTPHSPSYSRSVA